MGQLFAWIASRTSSRFRYAWIKQKHKPPIARRSNQRAGSIPAHEKHLYGRLLNARANFRLETKTKIAPGIGSWLTSPPRGAACGAQKPAAVPLRRQRRAPQTPLQNKAIAMGASERPLPNNLYMYVDRHVPRRWRAPAETAARARTCGRRTWTPWAPCLPSRCWRPRPNPSAPCTRGHWSGVEGGQHVPRGRGANAARKRPKQIRRRRRIAGGGGMSGWRAEAPLSPRATK